MSLRSKVLALTGHRVTTERTDKHLVVRIDEDVVAETRHPIALSETHLPIRWYVPAEDVRLGLLTAAPTTTVCPFKGTAGYFTYGDRTDIAWTYRTPIDGQEAIAGAVSFRGDGVSVEVR